MDQIGIPEKVYEEKSLLDNSTRFIRQSHCGIMINYNHIEACK